MSHSQSSSRPPNRLARETSPYLQQHAHNPVDWFPWGDEAFAKARAEDKPVFLSVGYSACHWCHVMERESFENENIARYLNEHFVSIKVDREERPDVDQIYMSAVQLITRRGGWPMSVFMTADGQPFYGGTYWPPTARMGMPGFADLLVKLHEYWKDKREEVVTSAQQLTDAIRNLAAPEYEQADLDASVLKHALEQLLSSADRRHGGFGGAPKFPHAMDIRVLLRLWKRFGSQPALDHALLTLRKMANGGIYDHLGGGFHRYSTDAHWLAPHFEKMLYDNALLVPAYLEAYQATGDADFARVARETLDYILREMTAPEGAFYSTQDADSEGEEGKFFVWREEEIDAVLNGNGQLSIVSSQSSATFESPSTLNLQPSTFPSTLFKACYDVTPHGNWEGHTILNRRMTNLEAATRFGMTEAQVETLLAKCRELLFDIRKQRIAPGRDEKILVSWNGMLISALALAARVLRNEKYLQAADRAADFILDRMFDADGRLLHSHKDGQSRFTAYLDDYACLIDGLVDLFQASGEERRLAEAVQLSENVLSRFADQSGGGFFFTASDHEALVARTKDAQDNATPSGNGMLATALLKLAKLTGRTDLREAAVVTLSALSGLLREHPLAAGQSLLALDFLLGPAVELVLVSRSPDDGTNLRDAIWSPFLPNKVVVDWQDGTESQLVAELVQGRDSGPGAQLYVCAEGACDLPVVRAEDAAGRIAAFLRERM